MSASAYAYPTSAIEDTGGPQRLHPDLTDDAGKLCMYKAMAGATTGDISNYNVIVEATKPLRRTFMVPFDDDVWALVLAYLYEFKPMGTYDTYADATEACDGTSAGDILYISIGASDPKKSGHAIYAVVSDDDVKYYDNEHSNTSKIDQKFKSGFSFLIFSRKGGSAPSHGTIAYKIANMPKSMVESLVQAHEAYGEMTVGLQRANTNKREDIAKLYAKRSAKAKLALKTNEALDKQITAWDKAMPKTS